MAFRRNNFLTNKNCVIFYNDVYEVVLPLHHKFPMQKYRAVRETLQKDFFTNNRVMFKISPETSFDELKSTHCINYISRFINGAMSEKENRVIGFPWSIAGVRRSLSSVGGTVAAMRVVMENYQLKRFAVSCHLAGGTHHAFYDKGEGFCVFSDIAVAANLALLEYSAIVNRILIVDLDVHQGNGNAELFKNNTQVYTFSMHCKANYFSTIRSSFVDVELSSGCGDEEYLDKLQKWLTYLMIHIKPQLIFYQAGVDIWANDRLGKLNMSKEGLQKRNQMVFSIAKAHGVGVVVTMGGGYPKDSDPLSQSFKSVVDLHCDVYRAAVQTAVD